MEKLTLLPYIRSSWESSIIPTGDTKINLKSCPTAPDIYEQMLVTYELTCHVSEPTHKHCTKNEVFH